MGKRLSINGGVRNPENKRRSSQTPGKSKGGTCTTDAIKKFYLTHPHAHRLDPVGYSKWHEQSKGWNKQK